MAQDDLEVRPQLDKHVVGLDVSVRAVTPVQEGGAVEKLPEGRHELANLLSRKCCFHFYGQSSYHANPVPATRLGAIVGG